MKAETFLKNISGKVAIFLHNDSDGCCSAAMMLKYVKEADLFSGDVNEGVFKDFAKNYDTIIFLDTQLINSVIL